MMPGIERLGPRAFRVACSALVASSLAAAGAAAWWALALPAPPVIAELTPAKAPAPSAPPAPVIATDWDLALWQPLKDEPPPAAAPAAPPAVKLISVVDEGGTLVAVLDPGDRSGMVYARAGETARGIAVTAIAAQSVEVEVAGQRVRLELGR